RLSKLSSGLQPESSTSTAGHTVGHTVDNNTGCTGIRNTGRGSCGRNPNHGSTSVCSRNNICTCSSSRIHVNGGDISHRDELPRCSTPNNMKPGQYDNPGYPYDRTLGILSLLLFLGVRDTPDITRRGCNSSPSLTP